MGVTMMIRFRIESAMKKHGTFVTLIFKKAPGRCCRVRTKAIINLYRKGLEKTLAETLLNRRSILGLTKESAIILFLPYNALDSYNGDGDVIVRVFGRDFVMDACTDIPFGEETVYTWMICRPAEAVSDDYNELGGNDDGTEN